MSFTFGNKDTKTQQQQSSQSDPWAPTVGPLNDFLSQIMNMGKSSVGVTPDQTTAFNSLKQNAADSGQYVPQMEQLANDTFGAQSRAPQVDAAYKTLTNQLSPYANGEMIDVGNNPYVRGLLDTVQQDTTNKINSMWGGAGRDFSGGHAMALGRGITSAEAPILLNQYNTEADRQIGTAGTLFGAGVTGASTAQNLDQQALGTRANGIAINDAIQNAKNAGPTAILNLEEQLKGMPLSEMGWIAQYLLPIAQLGQQSSGQGTSNTNTKGYQLGIDPKNIAQGLALAG